MGEHIDRPTENDAIPDTIGPFRISGVLGRGGMGVVYRGEHFETGASAAIKTIRAPSGAMLSSIRREIHALGRTRHPGVVRIIGNGLSNGLPWYAMDLLVGHTLRDYLRPDRSRLAPESKAKWISATSLPSTATIATDSRKHADFERESGVRRNPRLSATRESLLSLVRRLCSPLAHLHGRGIVHRDLKPENVFVQADETPVLVDLGISANGAQGREELDSGGPMWMGTVAYMAPEQIRGELVDARADLYALGCILYECVTGQRPFTGVDAFALRSAHLTRRPLAPSQLTDDVSPELDYLILRLLEKEPQDRLGYADDVARALFGVASDPTGTVERFAPPAYLYRPPFIGRESALHDVRDAIRNLDLNGRGGVLFVGGESGVGKTRLAMEAVLEATRRDVVVVLGQCSSLGIGAEAKSNSAPLHAFAPLFLAVADRCRERGVEETERLLGAHGKLLAAYQTALIDVPGYTALPNPARAEGQEARARVLAAATHTVLSFAEMRPVLLVIDDLQWSDELSISLVQRLTEHGIDNSALLVIGTYRIDEVGGALKELVHSAGSHRLELERLSSFDVRAMVQGMLALREAEPPLVDYLQAQSNGNPFFIVEYLRAVIADGILTRDNHGRWLLASREPRFDPSPALPRSLTDLIERRLRQLGTAGRKMVDAASVLGREFDGDLLIACAGVDPRVAADALEGLREKQILEESQHGRLRFVHDGLRELAYAHIDPSTLGRLHGQAASAIEATYRESDLEPYYGDLGHHCDKSGARQRAAHYFELAGDDARRRFATGSAVRFFRRALAQTTDPDESDGRAARLKESLGELLLLHGDAVEARTNLEASIEGTDRSQRVVRARRLRKLARVMAQQHLHADALAAYVLAERALEEPSADDATTYWHEFVQIQVDAAWDLYFTAKVDELDALVERVRPTVERYGQPAQRSRFFIAIAQSLVRRARYRVSDSALTFTQLALEIGENASDPHERAAARFAHAFPLLLRGNYRAAEPLFVGAIEGAERVGDAALLTRSLAYFGVLLRQTRRLADARQVSERALNLAEKTRMNDYLGVASANLAWATLCEGDEAHIEPHVTRALDAWAALPVSYVYPLQWLARLPYAAYLDGVGQFGAAVAQLTFLVNEHQYLLADDVRAEIQRLGFEHARNGSLSFGEVLARSRTENYL